jgi:predicted nucleotidyltransferase
VADLIIEREVVEKRRKKLESELARAVLKLRDMGAVRIILIGSLARDAWGPFSDIDLVAVVPTDERFLDRLKTAYLSIEPRVAMDILIYTPVEFEELSATSPFLTHALKGGKVLYAA